MKVVGIGFLKALGFLLVGGVLPVAAQQGGSAAPPPKPQFVMMSTAFSDGGNVPVKYSCDGKPMPVSPALQWINVPPAAVTFALIAHDPDTHLAKSMWDVTHWMMWNIPATSTQLPEGVPANPEMPDGTIQGKNVQGVNGYRGPCPTPGKLHHYTFELYVLDTKLDLGPNTARADLLKAMDGHIIDKSVYIGFFHR